MTDALRKLFNYHPQLRTAVFTCEWSDGVRYDRAGTWFETCRSGWRHVACAAQLAKTSALSTAATVVTSGDGIHIFPPGR
ncbi:MAG: hypothetical protein R2838_16295 [Caldilineaceae bacterium]